MTAGDGPEEAAGLAVEEAADIGVSLSDLWIDWMLFREEERLGLWRARAKEKAARQRGVDNGDWFHQPGIAAAGRSPGDVARGCSQWSTWAHYMRQGGRTVNNGGRAAANGKASGLRGTARTLARCRHPGE
jgi:hypothetical protein